MIQDINLRELAQMQGNGRDFVSVYCPGDTLLDSLRPRERELTNLLADDDLESEMFAANMALVRQVLEENKIETQSVCLFASDVLDFVRGYPIETPVTAGIYVGPAPYIRPLAELQDEYQTFCVVACDNSATRIYLVTNETAEVEESIRGGIKNRVRKGGWSQQRYSRRRDQQLLHYAREVVEVLEDVVRQREIERIVLIGSRETMREIEDDMSESLAELVVGREPFDLHEGEDAIIEEAYDAYFADERAYEQQLWDRIKNESMRHGPAVLGPTRVLESVQAGRAEAVIVTRDVEISGTSCRDCEHLVHGTPQTCQKCGSRSVFVVDLLDAVSRQAELTSATVEFADPIKSLQEAGNMAALLRWLCSATD